MKMLLYILIFLPIFVKAQINYDCHKQVLQMGIVDSEFIFGKWDGQKVKTETHIKYLGKISTIHKDTFKILNSVWIWGLSGRATTTIIVFNTKNEYVGDYYVGLVNDLPQKLVNGKLVFINEKRYDCDRKMKTLVDLTNGLPKEFFLKCKGEYGDIYSFESSK